MTGGVSSPRFTKGATARAQVRAELVQLEKTGYHLGDGDNTTYPEQIQAAEAKVAAQNDATGDGVVANGSSDGTLGRLEG